jgi:probable phosphoglycerate mutase
MPSTRFHLIRHATHGLPDGALPGRTPGIFLSSEGREQAARLARYLSNVAFDAIYCSPMERTRETADAIAHAQTAPVALQELPALIEVNYGQWTGANSHDLLQTDRERWNVYNAFRSGWRTPGGESLHEIQARVVTEIFRLRALHEGQTVALISHGDVLRAALCHFLAMPIDFLMRLEIPTASVSVVDIDDFGPRILSVNGYAG